MPANTITSAPNVSKVVVMGDGRVIPVEEGPAIVAQLLYAPPLWVLAVLAIVAVVVVALAAWSLRHNKVTEAVVDEMAENILSLFCC